MISRRQEIRDTALGREPVNQRHKTDIPLVRFLPPGNGVTRLQDETHWIRGAIEFLDLLQHRVHEDRMIVLKGNYVTPSPRVAVHNERILCDARRLCLRWEWRGGWGDRSNALGVLSGH